jgi:hypothetical protein
LNIGRIQKVIISRDKEKNVHTVRMNIFIYHGTVKINVLILTVRIIKQFVLNFWPIFHGRWSLKISQLHSEMTQKYRNAIPIGEYSMANRQLPNLCNFILMSVFDWLP